MNIPDELHYTADHEWVRAEDEGLRVGITDYAQDALGDVVYVELPAVGSSIESGTSVGEVESTKSVSDIYAPLTGTVVAVNEALEAEPGKINQDPYGDGWLMVLSTDDPNALESLLTSSAYQALTGE
ncbi:MAG: glycine cleavage system protein GcvH [Acidimicrobiales bacterium]|nr:glycine cleavage system protein GcvH [Acidimicrobiales bacterium]RZV46214.1 MAG: glycine cleavage system protein GcvH [Acidimicrobiales bacterium]